MRANQKLTSGDVEQIVQGLRNGESFSQLARDYKVSDTRIRQLAKQHGVDVPRRRVAARASVTG